ncbi:MAG: hypothetical protein Q4B70_18565, partial [Lachnospiraceae bacterium]|nr:hypothetical protein [Lachnospiraceae bacterium]
GTVLEKIAGYIDAQSNFSPTVIIASVLVFIGFKNLKVEHEFERIASRTFYIYLIHAFVLDVIVKIYNVIIGDSPNLWIWILLSTVAVFWVSFYCTSIFEYFIRVLARIV